MKVKLDVDASKLFEALKYQIHVAINCCHCMDKSDVLWIEVFGDVTIEGRDQVEVKNYTDHLSDSHTNFWNTLHNWLKPEFQHQQYMNLILLTTQAYGERASLKDWESSDTAKRLEILEEIYAVSKARFEKSKSKSEKSNVDATNNILGQENAENSKQKPPQISESLKLLHKVMAADNRNSLLDALPKIKIITEQPNLLELIAQYKKAYLKPILVHRQDDVIDALFGFMTTANKVTEGWRITGVEFDKKFAELTAKHMIGTVKFPEIDSVELELAAATINVSSRPFAIKLNEIGSVEDTVLQATADMLHAQQYIKELINDCATSQDDIKKYSEKQLRLHQSKRSAEMYKCASGLARDDLKTASCAFYHGRCGESVDSFGNYDDTPVEFRNGIYHMLADQVTPNPIKVFYWRLWN